MLLTAATAWAGVETTLCPTRSMTSSGRSPAVCAAEFACTPAIKTPPKLSTPQLQEFSPVPGCSYSTPAILRNHCTHNTANFFALMFASTTKASSPRDPSNCSTWGVRVLTNA